MRNGPTAKCVALELVDMYRGLRCLSSFASRHPGSVGLIGTGTVGTYIGENLLRHGLPLVVYDIDSTKMDRLVSKGATAASSAAECGSLSSTVLTALPAPAHVETLMKDSGLLEAMTPGSVWIDHSTTGRHFVLDIGKVLKSKGIRQLEAPITGGVELLRQGKMTILCGGDEALFHEYKEMLDMNATTVLYLGDLGSASVVKVVSNMLAGANTVLMGEALMIAKRSGVDLEAFWHGIRMSAGNSFVWETEAPLVMNGTYDPDFTLGLHCKDFALGEKLCKEIGLGKTELPCHSVVAETYEQARVKYGDDKGSSYPPKLLEDKMDTPLQAPGFSEWSYSIHMADSQPSGPGMCDKSISVVHRFGDKFQHPE